MDNKPQEDELQRKRVSTAAVRNQASVVIRLVVVLLSFTVVLILMTQLAKHLWLNQTGGWQDSEFDAATSRFQAHIMLAHVEWIRLNKPNTVSLEVRGNKFLTVPMAANGWPGIQFRVPSTADECLALWVLLAEPGNMRRPLSVEHRSSMLHSEPSGARQSTEKNFCYFYYNGEARFRYQPSNGQIYHLKRAVAIEAER